MQNKIVFSILLSTYLILTPSTKLVGSDQSKTGITNYTEAAKSMRIKNLWLESKRYEKESKGNYLDFGGKFNAIASHRYRAEILAKTFAKEYEKKAGEISPTIKNAIENSEKWNLAIKAYIKMGELGAEVASITNKIALTRSPTVEGGTTIGGETLAKVEKIAEEIPNLKEKSIELFKEWDKAQRLKEEIISELTGEPTPTQKIMDQNIEGYLRIILIPTLKEAGKKIKEVQRSVDIKGRRNVWYSPAENKKYPRWTLEAYKAELLFLQRGAETLEKELRYRSNIAGIASIEKKAIPFVNNIGLAIGDIRRSSQRVTWLKQLGPKKVKKYYESMLKAEETKTLNNSQEIVNNSIALWALKDEILQMLK